MTEYYVHIYISHILWHDMGGSFWSRSVLTMGRFGHGLLWPWAVLTRAINGDGPFWQRTILSHHEKKNSPHPIPVCLIIQKVHAEN